MHRLAKYLLLCLLTCIVVGDARAQLGSIPSLTESIGETPRGSLDCVHIQSSVSLWFPDSLVIIHEATNYCALPAECRQGGPGCAGTTFILYDVYGVRNGKLARFRRTHYAPHIPENKKEDRQ